MKGYIITIDGGTSKTKMCLWDSQEKLLKTITRPVGARDCAARGDNEIWKEALHSMIGELLDAFQIEKEKIQAVMASGMLTSNLGICEISHLEAPVSLEDLLNYVVKIREEAIAPLEITLIPGVKNSMSFLEDENLIRRFDIMRGEETEVYALVSEFGIGKDTIYILPGSHNKFVYVDKKGRILGCKTTLSGEMLHSITQDTILAASLQSSFVSMENYREDMVMRGYEAARMEGENRALFLTRILDLFGGNGTTDLQNYVLGVILKGDVEAICKNDFFETEQGLRIVVAGSSALCRSFYDLLKSEKKGSEILFAESGELPLAAKGAYLMARQLLVKGK